MRELLLLHPFYRGGNLIPSEYNCQPKATEVIKFDPKMVDTRLQPPKLSGTLPPR